MENLDKIANEVRDSVLKCTAINSKYYCQNKAPHFFIYAGITECLFNIGYYYQNNSCTDSKENYLFESTKLLYNDFMYCWQKLKANGMANYHFWILDIKDEDVRKMVCKNYFFVAPRREKYNTSLCIRNCIRNLMYITNEVSNLTSYSYMEFLNKISIEQKFTLQEQISKMYKQLLYDKQLVQGSDKQKINKSINVNELEAQKVSQLPQVQQINFQPLWKFDPQLWFETLEDRFDFCGIKSEEIKYWNLIDNVGTDALSLVTNTMKTLTPSNKYNMIKEVLLAKFTSNEEKLDKLFKNISMDKKTPSTFFQEIIQSADKTIPRLSIIKKWKGSLPINIQSLLTEEATLDNEEKLLHHADQIYEALAVLTTSLNGYTVN